MTLHLPVISTMSIPVRLERSPISWPKASEPNHVTHYPFAVTGIRGDVEDFAAKAIQQHVKWEGHKKGLPADGRVSQSLDEGRAVIIGEFLKDNSGCLLRTIAKRLGCSTNTARHALSVAVANGLAHGVLQGRGYSLYYPGPKPVGGA